MMLPGMWLNVGWMALVALIALGLAIWGWRRGQFRDVEEAKYRMLDAPEPAAWPEPEPEPEPELGEAGASGKESR